MSDGPEWFAAKMHGYGAGLPIAWQGWVISIGFVLIVLLGGYFLAPRNVIAYLGMVLSLSAIFIWIAARTTRGGWRWRWGEED